MRPRAGTLVIFPAWLVHKVAPWQRARAAHLHRHQPHRAASQTVGQGQALGRGKRRLAGAAAEYRLEPVASARLTGLAVTAARSGRKAEASAMLADLTSKYGDSNVYQQAELPAQLGDVAGAVSALARAKAVGDIGLAYVWTDPLLDPARGDAEFKALVARIG
jgi:hypothetical protein